MKLNQLLRIVNGLAGDSDIEFTEQGVNITFSTPHCSGSVIIGDQQQLTVKTRLATRITSDFNALNLRDEIDYSIQSMKSSKLA